MTTNMSKFDEFKLILAQGNGNRIMLNILKYIKQGNSNTYLSFYKVPIIHIIDDDTKEVTALREEMDLLKSDLEHYQGKLILLLYTKK